jgi:hypothetical protein
VLINFPAKQACNELNSYFKVDEINEMSNAHKHKHTPDAPASITHRHAKKEVFKKKEKKEFKRSSQHNFYVFFFVLNRNSTAFFSPITKNLLYFTF